MIYVLDTNAVSALMKGSPSVIQRLEAAGKALVRIPGPVIAEINYGIERLPSSKRKSWLRERFELVTTELKRVEWNDKVSESFGFIKATLEKRGTRLEDFDIAIAAHALAHQGVLVTANTEQMVRVPGLKIEDWSK